MTNQIDLRNRLQYRTDEAADAAGVSLSQMKVWIRTKAIRSYAIGQMRFVKKTDLIEFIDRHRNKDWNLAG